MAMTIFRARRIGRHRHVLRATRVLNDERRAVGAANVNALNALLVSRNLKRLEVIVP
jgi:hypothetical protein